MFEHDPDVLAAFAEESAGRIASLENGLLRLESNPANPEPDLLHAVFRDAHSVKAGANLLGLRQVETAAHRLENVLDLVRAGRKPATPEVCQALLDGVDLLRDVLADPFDPETDPRLGVLTRLARQA